MGGIYLFIFFLTRWGVGVRVGSITYLLEFGKVLHSPSKT
jgi:hypothetical protein